MVDITQYSTCFFSPSTGLKKSFHFSGNTNTGYAFSVNCLVMLRAMDYL